MSLNERTPQQRIAEAQSAIRILRGCLSRAPLFAAEAKRLIDIHCASIQRAQAQLNGGK